jgi:hypothetical protein
MTIRHLLLQLSLALAIGLTLFAPPASAGPEPTCCICVCNGLTQCTQADTAECEVCGMLNQTCEAMSVPGQCSAVAACTGVGANAAPAMGPNIMAVLAALLGATGVLRVRRGRKRKTK